MVLEEVERVLGAPFFKTESCLLYNADCLKALGHLPPSLIDLTVTSPPYNIGKAYEKALPLESYLDWCAAWTTEVHRVTKPEGALILNLGYLAIPGRAKAVPIPYLLWDRIPFYLLQEVVWHYGAGVSTRLMLSPRNEKFLWYVKDPDAYTFNLDDIRDKNVKYPRQFKNGRLKVNPNGKNPTDVWLFPKVTSGQNRSSAERTPHPAQFPEAVVERFIKGMSNKGDLVLDPFLGSGTTAAVALREGRRVVGFEVDEGYCALAESRIRATLAAGRQDPLFS